MAKLSVALARPAAEVEAPLEGALRSKASNVSARAPLRLGFAGGGTDVAPFCTEFGGLVMNATIGLYAYAHVSGRDDGRVEFNAADVDERWSQVAAPYIESTGCALLHKGVYNRVVADLNRGRPLAVTVTTTVDAPKGSGLGSSSALVVALLQAYCEYLRVTLDEHEIADIAFRIEREDLGQAGGAQDQYAAAFGGFNFIEFRKNGGVVVNPLRVRPDLIRQLESSIVLYFTGASRESATVIKQQQKNMIAQQSDAIEALKLLKEEALLMKDAILRGDIRGLGEALNNGWAQKKRTAAAVSNPEIDDLITGAFAHGAYAAKLSGAGGGGFMFLLCDPTRRHDLARFMKSSGKGQILPCHFTQHGAEAWRTSPTRD